MSNSNSLFFTDPDDSLDASAERVHHSEDMVVAGPPWTDVPTPSQKARQQRLFYPDSDDETVPTFERNSVIGMTPLVAIDDSGSEVELPSLEDVPRPSSVSSMSSAVSRDSSPIPQTTIRSSPPPAKKMRLSLKSPSLPEPSAKSIATYLGSFVVPNAWSTVKGHGYIKPGEEIIIGRDSIEDTSVAPSIKGKKKQMTLKTVLKSKPVKNAKRKTDTIVRITNGRGFGKYFDVE